jgi:hypothetical protein
MRTCLGIRSSFRIVSSMSGQFRGNVVTISALLGSSATTLTWPSTTLGSRSPGVATTATTDEGGVGAGPVPGPG